jgi:hypothetical protein
MSAYCHKLAFLREGVCLPEEESNIWPRLPRAEIPLGNRTWHSAQHTS